MSIKEKWRRLTSKEQDDRETDFLPAILEVTETPPSPVGRLVLWTLVSLLFVGILWSFFGTVDEVAVATGKIIPVGQVKTIQSKDKGIIKSIYVKEGDYVRAGDLLIELDPTSTGADLDSLKKRAAYYALDIDRLNAELAGAPFNPSLTPDLEEKDFSAQIALYQSRIAQQRAEISAAEMAISQKESALSAEQFNYEKYAGMLDIAEEKRSRLKMLVAENAIAEFQLLEQEAQCMELEKTMQAQADTVQKVRSELAEAKQKLANVDAAYKKDIMTNLVEARKQYYSYTEEIKKADENSRLSKIIAPVDGRVHQLAMHTVGGIVTEAQALLMIVPEDTKLEFEVWADNKDIGFIKLGQAAEVKVQTFNFQKFGVVDAEVVEISPDALDDQSDREKDKKYRLALSMRQKDMDVSGKMVPLTPGMEVTAEIKIKTKRIIDFFLDPFKKYTSEALRER